VEVSRGGASSRGAVCGMAGWEACKQHQLIP
jgi:hypothetical protein